MKPIADMQPTKTTFKDLTEVQDVISNDAPAYALPDSIGGFRVLRLLGSGGIEQVLSNLGPGPAAPLRRPQGAAHRGGLEAVLARLKREALLLAQLDHPHIARVHHAGTHRPTGLAGDLGPVPFFVMELVREEGARSPSTRSLANSMRGIACGCSWTPATPWPTRMARA